MWSCRSLLPQPSLPNCWHPKKFQASPCSLSQGQALYTAPILALGGRGGQGRLASRPCPGLLGCAPYHHHHPWHVPG